MYGIAESHLLVSSAVDHLFQLIADAGSVSNDNLRQLYVLFKHSAVGALDIVDRDLVTQIVAKPSGRIAYHVTGKSDEPYLCLNAYCSCPSYMFSVIGRSEAYLCKHGIAARLAAALKKTVIEEVRDDEWGVRAGICPSSGQDE